MKKMTGKESKEIYYVNISNSYKLRKRILETSKNVIESLHKFERFKKIRSEKIKSIESLIILFREINELGAQIRLDLPKIKLPAKKKILKQENKKKEVSIQKKEFEHESETELEKLEGAIAQIESRLNQIK